LQALQNSLRDAQFKVQEQDDNSGTETVPGDIPGLAMPVNCPGSARAASYADDSACEAVVSEGDESDEDQILSSLAELGDSYYEEEAYPETAIHDPYEAWPHCVFCI
jgi:hypothetical protein